MRGAKTEEEVEEERFPSGLSSNLSGPRSRDFEVAPLIKALIKEKLLGGEQITEHGSGADSRAGGSGAEE